MEVLILYALVSKWNQETHTPVTTTIPPSQHLCHSWLQPSQSQLSFLSGINKSRLLAVSFWGCSLTSRGRDLRWDKPEAAAWSVAERVTTDQPSWGRTDGGGGGGHFEGAESLAQHLLLVDLLVQPLDHWAHRQQGRQSHSQHGKQCHRLWGNNCTDIEGK